MFSAGCVRTISAAISKIRERPGAAKFTRYMRVEQHMRRHARRRFRQRLAATYAQRPDHGTPTAHQFRDIRSIFVAVQLHRIDRGMRSDAARFVERRVHQHGHARHERRQPAQPRLVIVEHDVALRSWKKVEPKRIRAAGDCGERVIAICNAADFHPHVARHERQATKAIAHVKSESDPLHFSLSLSATAFQSPARACTNPFVSRLHPDLWCGPPRATV
jgi:hypothetical protein